MTAYARDQPIGTASDVAFLACLHGIVGRRHVLTDMRRTKRYRTGFRSGAGEALAVVFPGSLLEQWRVLYACVDAGKAVLMQAANTGLTAGSTPLGAAHEYGRGVVIINTLRMNAIRVIQQGRQVICFPGSTLHQLERLLKPYGREAHSEVGSSCIGASVIGGVCNNSGGMLVRRGPAYTELSLYARVDAAGRLQLVNHLGLRLAGSAEEILERLDSGDDIDADLLVGAGQASCTDYELRVRDVDATSPARYNADPSCLYGASGSAGKLAVFAVRLDTFQADEDTQVFYIGVRDAALLTALRRRLLASAIPLPVAAEYMHRDIVDLAARYAKDSYLMIDRFGAGAMPYLFAWKSRIDRCAGRLAWLPEHFSDRLAQRLAQWLPQHLPKRMLHFRDRYEHHLLLKVSGAGMAATRALLTELLDDADSGAWIACGKEEGRKAFLHRFVAGGAAIRYRLLHGGEVGGVFSLDFALPRNERDWTLPLPPALAGQIAARFCYGHFLCHVFHHDYIVKPGADVDAVKQAVLDLIAARGGEYPAEHNVGHVYCAKPALAAFYRETDPSNTFNPGVGRMSRRRFYAEAATAPSLPGLEK